MGGQALPDTVLALRSLAVGGDRRLLAAAADEIERLRRENYKATIRGNGHARRAINTSDEVMRLRAQIAELLPFAMADAQLGASLGPHPDGEYDECDDCRWYESSVKLLARIVAGGFG